LVEAEALDPLPDAQCAHRQQRKRDDRLKPET
jgi:hypothetical protein